MDQSQLELLRVQYHDYFSIEQSVVANIKPLPQVLPDEDSFLTMIPEPFLMASEQAVLDRSALKSLAKLGDLAEELAVYLRAQAKKLDMMMRYLLIQQDDPTYRQHTHSFGGSALNFISNTDLTAGQTLEVKLFLNGSDGAVYFLATVLESTLIPADLNTYTGSDTALVNNSQFMIKAVVSRIRDEDRETLVRASLHEQSRQLKRKAQQRQLREKD
ncbi:PilZ domain-containing protein [Rheinheimera sp.]|uniref:PilZ domain-containing protein n=1 Tax=Rheinheimera sp. TaxID=1869214 RepID=UPI0027BA4C6D|nr:PilZ domain-containing protein [Rheinheimera sp.]